MSPQSVSSMEHRHGMLVKVCALLLCAIAGQTVQGQQQRDNSKLADSKEFTAQANGDIDVATASQQLVVKSVPQCSALCARLLVCSAFSAKKVLAGRENLGSLEHYQCTLSMGDYSWTPDNNATLYMADVGPLFGYTLSTDGKFYRLFNGGPWPISKIYTTCSAETGRVAVPYPGFAYKAIMSFLAGKSFTSFYVDIYRTGTSAENRWITTDGAVFYPSHRTLDTDQRWDSASQQPDGSGYGVLFTRSCSFDDTDNRDVTSMLCRRDFMYKKSPVNGKFYKLHLDAVTWEMATAECAKEGATLANVYFDADQIVTEPYRMMTRGLGNLAYPDGFWVGGTDKKPENTWVLPDGTKFVLNQTGDPLQKKLWQVGEPNGNTNANCMSMSYQGAADFMCTSGLKRFLCEIQLP